MFWRMPKLFLECYCIAVFEFWVLRASVFVFECFVFETTMGASFSSFGCFVFEIWVLCFRDLGALFSSLGCFVLGSSFSSASFSKLPRIYFSYNYCLGTEINFQRHSVTKLF